MTVTDNRDVNRHNKMVVAATVLSDEHSLCCRAAPSQRPQEVGVPPIPHFREAQRGRQIWTWWVLTSHTGPVGYQGPLVVPPQPSWSRLAPQHTPASAVS